MRCAMARVRSPTSIASSSLLSGSIATQTHWGERSKRSMASASLTAPSFTALSGKQFIELDLPGAHVVPDVSRKGLELLRRVDQPLQHRIRIDPEHPRRAP